MTSNQLGYFLEKHRLIRAYWRTSPPQCYLLGDTKSRILQSTAAPCLMWLVQQACKLRGGCSSHGENIFRFQPLSCVRMTASISSFCVGAFRLRRSGTCKILSPAPVPSLELRNRPLFASRYSPKLLFKLQI